MRYDRGTGGDEALGVEGVVVRNAILPATNDDSDQAESKGAYSGVMAAAACSLLPVEGRRPLAMRDGVGGELVEGLADELRTPPSCLDRLARSAADRHRRNAAEGLHG